MDHNFKLELECEQIRVSVEDDILQARAPWSSRDHEHAAYEMHILLTGACRVDVAEKSCHVHAHQGILIAPGQYHRAAALDGDMERFTMAFALTEGPLVRELRQEVPCCRVFPVTAEIEMLCRQIFREREGCSAFRRTALTNLLSLLLIRIFSQLNLPGDGGCSAVASGQRMYTELIDTFFEADPAKDLSLAALAALLHLSQTQTNRVLKKHYGVTFREKVIRVRMARAQWLLRHTDKLVDEIAGEVGYNSASAFHEMFRKRFSMTPDQYRQTNREGNTL